MARKRNKRTLAEAIHSLYPKQADKLLLQLQNANVRAETLHNAPVLMRETCGVDVYEMIESVQMWLANPPPLVKAVAASKSDYSEPIQAPDGGKL